MKKLLGIVVLGLLLSGNAFAETKSSVNYYTGKGYEIIKIIGGPKNEIQYFILQRSFQRKQSSVVICTVLFDHSRSDGGYTMGCREP